MKKETLITNLIWVVVSILALSVFINYNSQKNDEIDRLNSNYEAVSNKYESYKFESTNTMAAKDKTILVTKRELKKALKSDSIFRELSEYYKDLYEAVEIETEYVYVHDTIEVEVPIIISKDTTIDYSNRCIGLEIGLSDGLLKVSDINISNKQSILLGERKTGLFKTEQYLDVVNSNPCIHANGIRNYKVVVEKKWYNNPFIMTPIGFVGGWLVKSSL